MKKTICGIGNRLRKIRRANNYQPKN